MSTLKKCWLLESGIQVSLGEIALRWIRLAPMTAESLIVCAAIYLSCLFQATSNQRRRLEDVQRDWGAICPLGTERSSRRQRASIAGGLGTEWSV